MIYLSIDLDYWGYSTLNSNELPFELFDRLAQLKVNKTIVLSHEHLLPHINKHADAFDMLVNVDFHSDLCSYDDKYPNFECNEGTWGNFVRASLNKRFIWSPPHKGCIDHSCGYCHGETYPNPFSTKRRKVDPKVSGWQEATIQVAYIPELSECAAVGISLSPLWTEVNTLRNFAIWHKQYAGQFELGRGVKTSLKAALTN